MGRRALIDNVGRETAEPYLTAPVAVLIEVGTRSAAEGFVVFMDQIPGVTLVGRPSKAVPGSL